MNGLSGLERTCKGPPAAAGDSFDNNYPGRYKPLEKALCPCVSAAQRGFLRRPSPTVVNRCVM